MTQPQPPEPSNNHRSEAELPSFVKRGKLWIPETAQRRSILGKFWRWTGIKEKKLWDVLQLLIVPTALAIGAFYLQETAKQRDLEIAQANREKDQQIADDRAKQETLNRYFDQISTLLFERKLRTAGEKDEVRIIARARTLTALRELDNDRKGNLIKFINETRLIQKGNPSISLRDADLSRANLRFVNLSNADLSITNLSRANLSRALLWDTDLTSADLSEADLSNSTLSQTDLTGADLSKAKLSKASLISANLYAASLHNAELHNADLSFAKLNRADLSGVDLSRSDLSYVDLQEADLSEANLSEAKLLTAKPHTDPFQGAYLCKTILPNRTKSDRDCSKPKPSNLGKITISAPFSGIVYRLKGKKIKNKF